MMAVATSSAAALLARHQGIPLVGLDQLPELDLAFDGADEVDRYGNLIKGRGAAHTQEKVVASVARRFVVLIDTSKLVETLGVVKPLPVEVLPMAAYPVMRRLRNLGARPELRMGVRKDGPVVTDQGFWVVDAFFEDGIHDPAGLNAALLGIPGVLDHGLFVGMTSDILVGNPNGTFQHLGIQRS